MEPPDHCKYKKNIYRDKLYIKLHKVLETEQQFYSAGKIQHIDR